MVNFILIIVKNVLIRIQITLHHAILFSMHESYIIRLQCHPSPIHRNIGSNLRNACGASGDIIGMFSLFFGCIQKWMKTDAQTV